MANTDASSLIPADLVEEYAEIGADKLVEAAKPYISMLDPLGSEIPYVKTLVAAVKFPRTLSDFILGRKVYAFLYTSKIDDEKLEKFKQKFSKAKQERLWEQVVFSVNMHDDRMKSEIIGKLFRSLVDDEISESQFFTMVHATNSLDVHVLDELKELYMLGGNVSLSASRYYSFVTNGLIDIDNSAIGTIGGGGPVYPLNQTGWKYVGIVYDYPATYVDGYNLGAGDLVREYDPATQQATGNAYPLDYIKSKNAMYQEVDLFGVREDGYILCGEDGLPSTIDSVVPIAGEQPQVAAHMLAVQYEKDAHGVLIRKMEDVPVQKHAYIAKLTQNEEPNGFRSISEINVTINQANPKTDHIRYLVQVVEQIERHVSGELRKLWDQF
ncbi:MAG TPA: hypothetical protein VLE99_01170 [Candidatus Saccharimonadales bacterium]|nr:hypothetical protein [Candidatus Saccharimonadales bacterium]